ncbi:MAG TPA: DUF6318 family protein [Jatrophihabitantaceae bacterium]
MREHRVVLLCLLGACALAGCSSDHSAAADTSTPTLTTTYSPPSYSTAPASTPPITTGPNIRPGEKPPTFPRSLQKNLPSAAGAFAAYWEKTIDWGYATVDSSLPRTAYSVSCAGCARFMKIFDGARADGVHFRGGRLFVLAWTIQPNDHHNVASAVVDVTLSIQALQAIDRSGKVVESDPAVARTTDRIWVRWTGTRWTVVDSKHVVQK